MNDTYFIKFYNKWREYNEGDIVMLPLNDVWGVIENARHDGNPKLCVYSAKIVCDLS